MKRMILVASLLLGMTGMAFSAESRLGYLDTQRVVQSSEAGKAAKVQLQEKLKNTKSRLIKKKWSFRG